LQWWQWCEIICKGFYAVIPLGCIGCSLQCPPQTTSGVILFCGIVGYYMSIKIQSECWKIKLPPTQKLVLICLSEFADDNGRCYPSVDTIAERTGLNSRSVRRAISEIEKAGILTRSFCTGKRTDYIINPCHSVTPDTVSPLTESPIPLTLCPIPLTESTKTPDRGVNITTINHHEPSLTTITNNAPAKAVAKREGAGTRLPVDWTVQESWFDDAMEIGLDAITIHSEAIVFRDYWHGVAGAKGRKADWRATWRNWIRRKMETSNRNLSHAERKHQRAEHNARRDYSPATAQDF